MQSSKCKYILARTRGNNSEHPWLGVLSYPPLLNCVPTQTQGFVVYRKRRIITAITCCQAYLIEAVEFRVFWLHWNEHVVQSTSNVSVMSPCLLHDNLARPHHRIPCPFYCIAIKVDEGACTLWCLVLLSESIPLLFWKANLEAYQSQSRAACSHHHAIMAACLLQGSLWRLFSR